MLRHISIYTFSIREQGGYLLFSEPGPTTLEAEAREPQPDTAEVEVIADDVIEADFALTGRG
ncbi:hypothetical protein GCM10027447_25120 [Glycomyces halotolerans]